jgi:two-component system CheB/CheR fusion protein
LGEVCFLDPDTLAFKQVNAAAQRSLGLNPAQLKKMSLLELIAVPTPSEVKALVEALIARGEKETTLTAQLRTNDAIRSVQISLRLFAEEDPPLLMAAWRAAA